MSEQGGGPQRQQPSPLARHMQVQVRVLVAHRCCQARLPGHPLRRASGETSAWVATRLLCGGRCAQWPYHHRPLVHVRHNFSCTALLTLSTSKVRQQDPQSWSKKSRPPASEQQGSGRTSTVCGHVCPMDPCEICCQVPLSASQESPLDLPCPSPADSAHLGILGPVQRAGSIARILAVDLVAVYADDHFSTPGRERAAGQ